MVAKMRARRSAVSPVVSAIFANSGLSEGKANGFVSRRMHIWQHTDPDRTGMLGFAYDDDFGYRRYVEWALDVPMFFVVRDGELPPRERHSRSAASSRTGFDGERATIDDFERPSHHACFPRCGSSAISRCAAPTRCRRASPARCPRSGRASSTTRSRARPPGSACASTRSPAREAARADVARRGLAARYGDEPVIELARDLAADRARRPAPDPARRAAATPTRPASSIRCSSSSRWARAPARWWSTAGRANGGGRWID